jgi:hypothetical protein
MRANKTMGGREVSNHKRRKDQLSESSTDSTAHNQILKQQKQLNDRTHHIPININTEYEWIQQPHQKSPFANWIKKEDLTICCLLETHLFKKFF